MIVVIYSYEMIIPDKINDSFFPIPIVHLFNACNHGSQFLHAPQIEQLSYCILYANRTQAKK